MPRKQAGDKRSRIEAPTNKYKGIVTQELARLALDCLLAKVREQLKTRSGKKEAYKWWRSAHKLAASNTDLDAREAIKLYSIWLLERTLPFLDWDDRTLFEAIIKMFKNNCENKEQWLGFLEFMSQDTDTWDEHTLIADPLLRFRAYGQFELMGRVSSSKHAQQVAPMKRQAKKLLKILEAASKAQVAE